MRSELNKESGESDHAAIARALVPENPECSGYQDRASRSKKDKLVSSDGKPRAYNLDSI